MKKNKGHTAKKTAPRSVQNAGNLTEQMKMAGMLILYALERRRPMRSGKDDQFLGGLSFALDIKEGSPNQEKLFFQDMIYLLQQTKNPSTVNFLRRLRHQVPKGNIGVEFCDIPHEMHYTGLDYGEKGITINQKWPAECQQKSGLEYVECLIRASIIFSHELMHLGQDTEHSASTNVIQPAARATVGFLQELEAHRLCNAVQQLSLNQGMGNIKNLLENYANNFHEYAICPGYKYPRDPDEVYREYSVRLNIPMEKIKEIEANFRIKYPDYPVRTEGDMTYYETTDREIRIQKTAQGTILEGTYFKDIASDVKDDNTTFPVREHRVFDVQGNLKQTDFLLANGERWILDYQSDFELLSMTCATDTKITRYTVCADFREFLTEKWTADGYTLIKEDRMTSRQIQNLSQGTPRTELEIPLYEGQKKVVRYDDKGAIIPLPRPAIGKIKVADQIGQNNKGKGLENE